MSVSSEMSLLTCAVDGAVGVMSMSVTFETSPLTCMVGGAMGVT